MCSKVVGTRNIMLSKKGQVQKEKKTIFLSYVENICTHTHTYVCGVIKIERGPWKGREGSEVRLRK